MPTWFAQNSSVNIDSVNQWNSAANGSGSFLTWANLSPTDILVANGKTSIAINVDFTCALITNVATGGTAGGGFVMNAGRTITTNITTSSATCVSITAAGTFTIIGNITGGTSGNAIYGVDHNSTGTLNVVGNVTGGTVGINLWAIAIRLGGALNVTGTVTGGSSGTACRAIGTQNNPGAVINITGNVIGASAAGVAVINVNASLFITGNISGAVAIEAGVQTLPILITGDIVCDSAAAVIGAGAGTVISHNGSVIQNTTFGRGVFNSVIYRIHPSANRTRQYRTYDTTSFLDNGSRTYYTGGINIGHPATSNVRLGTVYGAANEFTGTLAVPSPTLVAIGVATDNTVGSYAPTGGLDAAGVRAAIGLAAANLDAQLATKPDAAGIRSAVGLAAANLDTQLSDIPTVTEFEARTLIASGYASSTHWTATRAGYLDGVLLADNYNIRVVSVTGSKHIASVVHDVEPAAIPEDAFVDGALSNRVLAANAAAEVATAVRTELAIELGRIDVANSSRLASSAYTAPDNAGITLIKTVTDRLNTGLVQDGAVWQFTVNMLENGPVDGGGGSATVENQLLILGQLDVIQNKTDLISGASGITSLLAGAILDPGQITSFPETLTIGDSYTEANGRAIQIPVVDTNGVPISSTGSLYFSSATVTFVIKRAGELDSDRIISGTATFVDPPGTGTGDEAPYVVVELSSSETLKGLVKYKYTGILTFTWPGTSDEVMSFETNTITFRE